MQEKVILRRGVLVAGSNISRGCQCGPVSGIPFDQNTEDDRVSKPTEEVIAKVFSTHNTLTVDDGGQKAWIHLLNPARDVHEQNLQLFRSHDRKLYIRACRDISRGERLYVWYDTSLALEKNVPHLTPSQIQGSQRYCCSYCKAVYAYPNMLKLHIMHHCQPPMDTTPTRCRVQTDSTRCLQKHNVQRCKGVNKVRNSNFGDDCRCLIQTHSNRCLQKHNVQRPDGVLVNKLRNSNLGDDVRMKDMLKLREVKNSGQGICERSIYPVAMEPSFRINASFEITPQIMFSGKLYASPEWSASLESIDQQIGHHDDNHIGNHIEHHIDHHIDNRAQIVNYLADDTLDDVIHETEEDETEEPYDMLSKSYLKFSTDEGHLCIFCGKLYSRKYGLKIHLRTHTGYKPLKCKICRRAFGDPSNLNKHVRLHTQDSTSFQCLHCGKVLLRKRDLTKHMKDRHKLQPV